MLQVEVVTGAGIATGTAHHAGTAAVGADRHVVVVSAATAAAGHQHTGAAAGVAAGAGHHRAGTAHLGEQQLSDVKLFYQFSAY